VEEMFIHLTKRDITSFLLNIFDQPTGAVGTPTRTVPISAFSDIKLMDGLNDKDPNMWFDGQDIDVVLYGLQALTRKGEFIETTAPVVQYNLHIEEPLDDVSGKSLVSLEISQYLSTFKDPILFFKSRDMTTWFDYDTTNPTNVEVTVNVDNEHATGNRTTGVKRLITDMRRDHKIPLPTTMLVKAIAVIFSNGWGGTVQDMTVFDGEERVAWLDDEDRMRMAEQRAVRCTNAPVR
jgi:hypothetical protein